MGVLNGNPKDQPMHYGEVFATWSYVLAEKAMIAMYQTLVNHTGDDDLKNLIEEGIAAAREESEQVEQLLKFNGVQLPPAPPERPVADLEEIPAGARMMDPEIAAIVSTNVAKGLITCSSIMGESIREDIALMFGQFHMKKAQFGAKALKLAKEKGWLIIPPLHGQK